MYVEVYEKVLKRVPTLINYYTFETFRKDFGAAEIVHVFKYFENDENFENLSINFLCLFLFMDHLLKKKAEKVGNWVKIAAFFTGSKIDEANSYADQIAIYGQGAK